MLTYLRTYVLADLLPTDAQVDDQRRYSALRHDVPLLRRVLRVLIRALLPPLLPRAPARARARVGGPVPGRVAAREGEGLDELRRVRQAARDEGEAEERPHLVRVRVGVRAGARARARVGGSGWGWGWKRGATALKRPIHRKEEW